MSKYRKGDHVKVEVTDTASGESEWMWLLVEKCDDAARVVFGTLDNQPIVNTDLHLGQALAVSYDKISSTRRF